MRIATDHPVSVDGHSGITTSGSTPIEKPSTAPERIPETSGAARLLSPPPGWDEIAKKAVVTEQDTIIRPEDMASECHEDPSANDRLKMAKEPKNDATHDVRHVGPSSRSLQMMSPRANVQPGGPSIPRRPLPSPAPQTERPPVNMLSLRDAMDAADESSMGKEPPPREERRWIEAALRRMFRALGPTALGNIAEAFCEWHLPPKMTIVTQGSPIASGPGLCVLFEGVVDVLHRPKGAHESEKVCTYDRRGQCFGELELVYDAPRTCGPRRKAHWATIATRTPVTVWVVSRDVLRKTLPNASNKRG